MNNSDTTTTASGTPAPGHGTSVTDSENPLTLLCEAYERLGLATGDAWDAATADYRAYRERLAAAA